MRNRQLTLMNLVSGEGKGGAEKLALDIFKGLRARGHRVIWGCSPDFYFLDEARASGFDIYICNPSGNMDMRPLPAFIRFCREQKVDIVNVHDSHGRHLLVAAKLLGLKAKAVFTRHCISGSAPYIGAFFYNLTLDMNIAVSNIVRRSLLRGGVWPRKAVTIYGGIESERFEHVPMEKVEWFRKEYVREGSFHIGIVARLGLYKGFRTDKPTMKRHEVLFRALAGLDRDFHLLAVGTHTDKDVEYLKIIAEDNGLDAGKITFCGFHKEIYPFYKIMDLNVLPSPNEGLGLVIIEAMAAGVPCIGVDSGGIREIITDGVDGFLFKSGDSRDLADKIRIIIENKEIRDSFIMKGREKVKELFDIEKTVRETEKIFYELINS